jgi:hypothetical protein
MSLSVSVEFAEDAQGFDEYAVVTRLPDGVECEALHRYSDFAALQRRGVLSCGPDVPPLPPKRYFRSGAVRKQRSAVFQELLCSQLAGKTIDTISNELAHFLCVDKVATVDDADTPPTYDDCRTRPALTVEDAPSKRLAEQFQQAAADEKADMVASHREQLAAQRAELEATAEGSKAAALAMQRTQFEAAAAEAHAAATAAQAAALTAQKERLDAAAEEAAIEAKGRAVCAIRAAAELSDGRLHAQEERIRVLEETRAIADAQVERLQRENALLRRRLEDAGLDLLATEEEKRRDFQ